MLIMHSAATTSLIETDQAGDRTVQNGDPTSLDGVEFIEVLKVRDLGSVASRPITRAIYAIRNNATGNFYIGSSEHVFRRFRHHVSRLRRGAHHSIRLQWAWKTRGDDFFDFVILEIMGEGDDLIVRESEVIETLRPAYNTAIAASNPMLGRRHSPESIEKMRVNRRGKGLGARQFSEAHKAALSAAMLGRPSQTKGIPRKPEHIAKMAAAHRDGYARGARKPKTRPVNFRGADYASVLAAAAANSMNSSSVIKRIKAGEGSYLN